MASPTSNPTGPVHGDRARSRAPVRLRAGAVVVEFLWAGDRWRHVVTAPDDGGDRHGSPGHRQGLDGWHSLEGPVAPLHDPRRPGSPVITELSVVGPAEAPRALLGVGHAGCSHCSLAVTVDDDDPSALRFEVACRLSAAWPGLGSAYRHHAAGKSVAALALQPHPGAPRQTLAWTYRFGPAGLVTIEGAVWQAGEPGGNRADAPT
ncbi:MAG: hypothetical protein ACOYK7_05710 [Pirellulales bacterium]